MIINTAWLLKRADRKLSVKGMDADVVTITRSVIKELASQHIYVGSPKATGRNRNRMSCMR